MSVNHRHLLTGTSGHARKLTWLIRPTIRRQRATSTNKRNPHPAASPAEATSPPHITAAEVCRLLPFSPHQIAEAATLACAFTAAYTTYRHDEPPEDHLRRLDAMMSPHLRPLIERTTTDPDTLLQRRRAQQNSTGQAHPQTIRAINPTSITIVITATQQLTTTYVTRSETTRYALTLTPSGRGWQVHAVELGPEAASSV